MYSPGRKRKKNASAIISAVAWMCGELPELATCMILRITWMGIGFTRCGGGSAFS